VGEVKWRGERGRCQICGTDTSNTEFVDGATPNGQWAIMCLKCHREVGSGLGIGRGQAYGADGVKKVKVCRACANGDCYGHVAEFLENGRVVTVCRCPDPLTRHGKLRPPEDGQKEER